MATHKCTETDRLKKIEDINSYLSQKVIIIEEQLKYMNEKVTEIHKILIGNGRPGLVDKWNQFEGATKAFNWIVGIMLVILTIAVSVLAQ